MIPCTRCRSILTADAVNTGVLATCSACGVTLQADVYPALFNGLAAGHVGELLQSREEAGCFYHPDKRALRPCSSCGRFMCALCDIELEGKHLCPICLEKGKSGDSMTQLVDRRVCYDQVALLVAFVPIILFAFVFFVPTVITAPIAIFMVFRYWNAPASILPHSKIRFVIALTLSLLQIIGWLIVIFNLTVGG